MLVQGVNLFDAKADALLREFRFVPDARLDDLMVSFATDGGGVGPHFDSYDVFLLQAQGQRRWKIGAAARPEPGRRHAAEDPGQLQAEEEFVLNPGDMLYLPPHYAHDGVADRRLHDLFDRLPFAVVPGAGRSLPAVHGRFDRPAGPLRRPDLEATSKPAEIPRTCWPA
jgi:50S ribosomal protein L16 3-hydroxylase